MDQPKSIYLAELALELAVLEKLDKNGAFRDQGLFQGEGFDNYVLAEMRKGTSIGCLHA